VATSPKAELLGLIGAAAFAALVQPALAGDEERHAALKRAFEAIEEQRRAEDEAIARQFHIPDSVLQLPQFRLQAWSEEAKRTYEEVDKRRATEDASTATEWAESLDRLPEDGWTLLKVSADGQRAYFASRRQLTRNERSALAWFRFEYRHPAYRPDGSAYRSFTGRYEYDCAAPARRVISVSYYVQANLTRPDIEHSYVVGPTELKREPVSPGTIDDEMAEWACKHAPVGAKKQATRP
jgi:hypothetical protein